MKGTKDMEKGEDQKERRKKQRKPARTVQVTLTRRLYRPESHDERRFTRVSRKRSRSGTQEAEVTLKRIDEKKRYWVERPEKE